MDVSPMSYYTEVTGAVNKFVEVEETYPASDL